MKTNISITIIDNVLLVIGVIAAIDMSIELELGFGIMMVIVVAFVFLWLILHMLSLMANVTVKKANELIEKINELKGGE